MKVLKLLDPFILQELMRQREDYVKIKDHGEKFIDQVITSLVVGLLGFTIAFKEKFISLPAGSLGHMKYSWYLLGGSVLMIVANNLISIESAMHAIRQIDKAIRTHDEALAKEQFKIPWQSKMIRVINVLICLSFLIGLGIIVVYAAKL